MSKKPRKPAKLTKALTIHQPWAWAILRAGKNIENRTWPTSYRGPLLIHAGKFNARWFDEGMLFLHQLGFDPPRAEMQYGAIVGVVDLVDCIDVGPCYDEMAHKVEPWGFGPWCWILQKPRRLEAPIPTRGHQGLWEFEGDIEGA